VTPSVLSVLDGELLKVRKRWLPYLLLLVMVGGAAFTIWLVGYGSWIDERNEADYNFGRDALRTFTFPWAFVSLLDVGQFWGGLLVGVLAASVVATEHNWGTVRQALIRGRSRSSYLTVKLAGIAVLAAAIMLVALAIGIGFSLIATSLADEPITLDVPNGPSAFDIAVMVLRTGLAILPYGLLAFCLTVIGRSTTLGVVGIVLYMVALEPILIGVLGGLGGPAPDIRAFLLGHNANALIAANRIGSDGYYSFAFRELPESPGLPNVWVAAFAVGVYCAAFLAIAYSVFQRRDLGVEAGGS